jgi:alpha-D-ribose 1-methylphosphonate 5-triphosphate synthase subunit PhnI
MNECMSGTVVALVASMKEKKHTLELNDDEFMCVTMALVDRMMAMSEKGEKQTEPAKRAYFQSEHAEAYALHCKLLER